MERFHGESFTLLQHSAKKLNKTCAGDEVVLAQASKQTLLSNLKKADGALGEFACMNAGLVLVRPSQRAPNILLAIEMLLVMDGFFISMGFKKPVHEIQNADLHNLQRAINLFSDLCFFSFLSSAINVLHRMCYRRKYKLMNERYECTLTKMLGGLQVPFDVSDDVDLVVLGVEGDERKLRGCYFFPQDVLVAQSVFSVGHEGGLTAVSLYPPFAIPSIRISEGRRDRIRVMQQWQAEFYVDLTDSCVFEDSRRKFLEILNRVRSSKGM